MSRGYNLLEQRKEEEKKYEDEWIRRLRVGRVGAYDISQNVKQRRNGFETDDKEQLIVCRRIDTYIIYTYS